MTLFLLSGGEYVGGVKIYEVFYFSEAQVKTKKEEFSQKGNSQRLGSGGSRKVHG